MNTQPPEDWNDLTALPAEDPLTQLELPAPPKPRGWLLPGLFVLSVAALAAGWHSQANLFSSGPNAEDLLQGRNAALRLADKAVRDYARRNGQYPARLEEAIVLPPELQLEYAQSKSGFELHIASSHTP